MLDTSISQKRMEKLLYLCKKKITFISPDKTGYIVNHLNYFDENI